MRLTHPRPELGAPTQPRLVAPTRLRHPGAEVVCAHPARVEAAEEAQEGLHVGLLLGRGAGGVGGCHGVKEGPG